MFVKNKMTSNPFTISPAQTIPDAQEIIKNNGIKRLPVVDNGKLVGVVSRGDIVKVSPSKATALSMGEITYLLAKTKISSIMSKNPVTVSPNALLEEAALLMRDNDIGFLPVVDNEKLVGIITEGDIFDSFIELLGFREPGTRMTIEVDDAPGMLSMITSTFAKFNANITHVAVYSSAFGKSNVVIGTNSLNTTEIEKYIAEQGCRIIYRIQNK